LLEFELFEPVFGIALTIASSVGSNVVLLAWGPEFFARVHAWPKGQTGLVLGLITLVCGCAGLLAGGRLSDYWHRNGVVHGALRVGLISVIGIACTLAPATLMHDVAWTIALLVPAVVFLAMPTGCGYAAVQMIFPNQSRGLASASVTFIVAMLGLGLGAQLPGVFNDHVFHDGSMIGLSMSLTVALSSLLGLVAVLSAIKPYQKDYLAMHPAGGSVS
jgi:nitrate/nitrite transporter NarK